jgi:hypothetical protein
MSLARAIRFAVLSTLLMLSFSGVALAQCSECGSIMELDPALALNGFALISGAIVLLFETYRSKP